MATLFVCRHPGAIAWMKQQPIKVDQWLSHLEPSDVQEGDTVIGILPMEVAAEICKKHAHFVVLSFRSTQALRGKELTQDDLTSLGCHLTEYIVSERRKSKE